MACPLEASGSLHPAPVQMAPCKTFLYTEAKLDPIYTPDLGSGAETPSRQRRRCWRERCGGLDPILSLAAVAELVCVIGSEVSIAPQVQPGTLGRLLGVQVFCDLEGREMVKMGVFTIRQPEQPRRMPRSHPHPSPAPCVPGSLRVKAKGIVRLVS